jgi:hypothetical protein
MRARARLWIFKFGVTTMFLRYVPPERLHSTISDNKPASAARSCTGVLSDLPRCEVVFDADQNLILQDSTGCCAKLGVP